MKKKYFLLVLLFAAYCKIWAQPTQAEIDKKLKEAQAMIDKIKADPKNKSAMGSVPNIDSIMNAAKKTGMTGQVVGMISMKRDTASNTLPSRNAKLNSLPTHVYSKAELTAYINRLLKLMSNTLGSALGTKIADVSNVDAATIRQAAVIAWTKGQADQAVLLALNAASKNPDDLLALNNLGGLLNVVGMELNAIPVLEYAVTKFPRNPSLLNNLGQAYIAVGEQDKAEKALQQCVQQSPYHPNANLTLAYINQSKGKKDAALHYTEQSLTAGFSSSAYYLLHKLKPDANLMNYLKHRYKQPEYFNFYKYPLPPQCMKVTEAKELKKLYADFKVTVTTAKNKFSKISRENKIAAQTQTQKVMSSVKLNKNPMRPFYSLGVAVVADLQADFSKKLEEYKRYEAHYKQQIEKLDEDYAKEMKAVEEKWKGQMENDGEGHGKEQQIGDQICADRDAVGNAFLPRYASLTTDYQKETIRLYQGYFNDLMFWSYFTTVDDHGYRDVFASLASDFLIQLGRIATTKLIFPCSQPDYSNNKSQVDSLEIKQPECPINFTKKILVGQFHIDCNGLQFEAGEGLILNLDHDFKTHKTIIAIGPGFEGETSFEFGALEGKIEATGKEQYFIVFDGGGMVADQGLKWEGQMKFKETVDTGIKKQEVSKIDIHGGWTLGVESGWDFDKGTLFPYVDKFIETLSK